MPSGNPGEPGIKFGVKIRGKKFSDSFRSFAICNLSRPEFFKTLEPIFQIYNLQLSRPVFLTLEPIF
jgi:hypothetical protein